MHYNYKQYFNFRPNQIEPNHWIQNNFGWDKNQITYFFSSPWRMVWSLSLSLYIGKFVSSCRGNCFSQVSISGSKFKPRIKIGVSLYFSLTSSSFVPSLGSESPNRIWFVLDSEAERECVSLIDWFVVMMENGNEIESTDEERPPINPPRGRQYRPVGSHDRAVIQMASMEPGSTSDIPLRFAVHPFHAKCRLYILY